MEMTFRREATQRQISFTEIATATTLPVDHVEMLIMKALAQGLVKGKIDGVAGSVSLTWVQPRVLDATQLGSMLDKIGGWVSSVGSMEVSFLFVVCVGKEVTITLLQVLIENKAGEILTY